jgi:hypothetical protein
MLLAALLAHGCEQQENHDSDHPASKRLAVDHWVQAHIVESSFPYSTLNKQNF